MREIQFKVWYRGQMYDRVNLYIEPDYTRVEIVKGRGNNVHTDTTKAKLLQFTGLKDKNGVPIYEGDVVKHPKYGSQGVIWKYGGFGLDIRGVGGFTDGFSSFSTVTADYENCEVIGNIYENPDLLSNPPHHD